MSKVEVTEKISTGRRAQALKALAQFETDIGHITYSDTNTMSVRYVLGQYNSIITKADPPENPSTLIALAKMRMKINTVTTETEIRVVLNGLPKMYAELEEYAKLMPAYLERCRVVHKEDAVVQRRIMEDGRVKQDAEYQLKVEKMKEERRLLDVESNS